MVISHGNPSDWSNGPSQTNKSERNPVLEASNQRSSLVSQQFSLVRKFHESRKGFFLLEMLSIKACLEGLTEVEEFLAFDLYLFITDSKDPFFWTQLRKSRFYHIEVLLAAYKNKWYEEKVLKELVNTKFKYYLSHPRTYFGWRHSWKVEHYVKRRNRLLEKKAPPSRFIGVGYKDKGTTRNVAWDGSLTWSEIYLAKYRHEEHQHSPSSIKSVRYYSHLQHKRVAFGLH